jgi:hypothetical protein
MTIGCIMMRYSTGVAHIGQAMGRWNFKYSSAVGQHLQINHFGSGSGRRYVCSGCGRARPQEAVQPPLLVPIFLLSHLRAKGTLLSGFGSQT